jgi:hypothetical protein
MTKTDAAGLVVTLLMLLAFASITYGFSLMYEPLGFVVGGVLGLIVLIGVTGFLRQQNVSPGDADAKG